MSNKRIQELQQRLNKNMDKAVKLAENNCTRNEDGYIVLSKDDEWRDKDNTFENMIKAGEEFENALGISDNEIYDLLKKDNESI